MKADGRLERHAYAGTHGDTYAIMMAAIGHNLRLLLVACEQSDFGAFRIICL
jgi:hypothetical protein